MYARRDFDPADPGEDEDYSFDFSRDTSSDDSIVSATWECEVAASSAGEDADASTRLVGSPGNSGLRTSHRVVGLQAGVKYMLRATVVTTLGHTKSLWSYVDCREPT